MLTNIRSLRYKTDELEAELLNNNIDICCITESWLTDDIPTESVNIDGYVCYRHDRTDGRQAGGVVCYVRQDLPFTLLRPVDNSGVESLWLLYRQPHMPRSMSHIVFGTVYHPPDAANRTTTTHITDNIDAVVRQHSNACCVIVGDFNKMIDKPLQDIKLKQIVQRATRKSAILDKIYTNIGQWYMEPTILPNIAKSDHQAVMMLPIDGVMHSTGHRITVSVRSKDSNRKAQLARHLATFDWSAMYYLPSTELMATYFYDVTTSLLEYYLPLRSVSSFSTEKPWITDEFRRLIRQRQYAWTHNNKSEYNRLRNSVNRSSRKLRERYYKKKIEGLRQSNATNWWRQTKKLTGQVSKQDLAGLANETTDGNMQRLANNINTSLVNVSADLDRLTVATAADQYVDNDNELMAPPGECAYNYEITAEIVFNKLERINIRKAPGPDNLPNWFLRDFGFALCDPLAWIFNSSIKEGIVPSIWKKANVVAIPKIKPPKSIEQDLRPISLTPTISRIFESIVGKWMLDAIGDKFDKKQFGAIKGRSTSHALVDIMHKWHKAMDERNAIRVVFIDYAKAFDHVDHLTVIKKLAVLGVTPIILRWIHSFLMDRQQRVKVGNGFSDWASPNGGMPQGTYLGPYVFLAMINDLKSPLELHKFVDDCTLSEIIQKSGASIMQQAIDSVDSWSSLNHMIISTKKTKEMLIGSILKNPPSLLQLNGQLIERVKSYKLLGLHVTDSLQWKVHVSSMCSRAAQRLHFLQQLKRAAMSSDDLLYYYQSVVRPVIEYACVVWHTSLTQEQTKQLESIQKRAMKIIFGSDSDDLPRALAACPSLAERREWLTKRFFTGLLNETSCLHELLPAKRDSDVTGKLRDAKQYPVPWARTERFRKSTILYALNHFQ